MAYTIKYNPAERYISAHGDVVFVVLDDTKPFSSTTYPDYKYVCDVYVKNAEGTETQVARLKSYPRPNDKLGVFAIGSIVRSYLLTQFNPTPNAIRSQQLQADAFFVQVICRFGDEYNFTTYPNLLIDSQRAYFNHYNGRQYGTDTVLQAFLDKVMTNRPYETSVTRTATHNLIPFLASDDTEITVEIRCYNKSLGLIRQVDFPIAPTEDTIDEVQQCNLAPANINAVTPGTIDAIVDYYTATFSTTNEPEDSIYRFNIICENKYETKTLHFLNKYGGFESKEFTKVSRKPLSNINRSNYGRAAYNVGSDGSVTWFNSTSKVYNEQTNVFSVEYEEKMQINSDILSDEEYVWLEQLVVSPQVYIQEQGYFFAVKITDTNYEPKKIINDKLTNLTLNIEFGERLNTQYR